MRSEDLGHGRSGVFMGQQDRGEWVDALIRAEAATGAAGGDARPTQIYRRFGRWLLADRLLLSELGRRWLRHGRPDREIPRLSALPTQALLRARFLDEKVELPVAASAVLFESNIRSFYVSGTGTSIKILGAVRDPAEFRRDVTIRREVARSGTVRVPHVFGEDLSGPSPYILEELVFGRKAEEKRDRDLLLNRFVPQICGMYKAFGIGIEPFSAYFDADAIRERIASVELPPEWRLEWDCRDDLIRRLDGLASVHDQGAPVSLGHGDLAVGNLIISPAGEIVVVDWELARRMPMALDFRKLLLTIPGIWRSFAAWLAAEAGAGDKRDVVPPGRQAFAAVAARLADRCQALALAGASGQSDRLRHLKRIASDLRTIGRLSKEGAFD